MNNSSFTKNEPKSGSTTVIDLTLDSPEKCDPKPILHPRSDILTAKSLKVVDSLSSQSYNNHEPLPSDTNPTNELTSLQSVEGAAVDTVKYNRFPESKRQKNAPPFKKKGKSNKGSFYGEENHQTRIWEYSKSSSFSSSFSSLDNGENVKSDTTPTEPDVPKTHTTYMMGGVQVHFPFTAYKSQIQMMSKIITALKNSNNALLESPTGTGKSLALLCASLAWQSMVADKINEPKHQTMNQNQKEIMEKTFSRHLEPSFSLSNSSLSLSSSSTSSTTDPSSSTSPTHSLPSVSAASTISLSKLEKDEDFQYTLTIQKPPSTQPQPSLLPESCSADPPPVPEFPKNVPKIFFTSRTHKQLAQVIKELRSNTIYRPKMTVLGSRNQYCIHDPVIKSVNRDEVCAKHVEEHTCPYYDNTRNLQYSKAIPSVWDIEDLKVIGSKRKGCPYYAARQLAEDAMLIFCPYNYLVDPIIRTAMDIDITDNIIIIDEGHNIEDCSREAATCEITDKTLTGILQALVALQSYMKSNLNELDDFKISQIQKPFEVVELIHLVQTLLYFLNENLCDFEIKDFEKQSKILAPSVLVRHLALKSITKASLFVLTNEFKNLNGANLPSSRDNQTSLFPTALSLPLRQILLLLEFILDPFFTNDFHVVIVERIGKKGKSDDWNAQLAAWCMNPGVPFSKLRQARSVVITSGTLSPMNSFASELQTRFQITLEADHVLQPHQVWVGVFPQYEKQTFNGIYKVTETFSYQDHIGLALLSILKEVPHGTLLFVPSYYFIDKLVQRWTTTGCLKKLEKLKSIFYENRVQTSFEPLLAEYYAQVDASAKNEGNGALLIAVYRGKVSEGIDFSDHRARAVICVGIPYPSTADLQVKLKREYNDKHKAERNLLSGSGWYDIQAFRALNQALGRCLRHRNDWGALILLEERMKWEKYQKGLSKWVRQRLVVHYDFNTGMHSLRNHIQSQLATTSGTTT